MLLQGLSIELDFAVSSWAGIAGSEGSACSALVCPRALSITQDRGNYSEMATCMRTAQIYQKSERRLFGG